MLILKDLLLWALVLVHVVGAAFLFRRLLPRESRWLAFLLPEIAFVLLGNFVEHEIALTHLRLLLPLTSRTLTRCRTFFSCITFRRSATGAGIS